MPSTRHSVFQMNALIASPPPLRPPVRRPRGGVPPNGRRSAVFASRRRAAPDGWRREYDGGGGEGLVDESMIVLRKRMQEMRMAERNYQPPAEWTQWEKQRYATYGRDVCAAMGLLQTLLINTRPGVAVGMVAAVALSVSTSSALLLVRLLEELTSLCGLMSNI